MQTTTNDAALKFHEMFECSAPVPRVALDALAAMVDHGTDTEILAWFELMIANLRRQAFLGDDLRRPSALRPLKIFTFWEAKTLPVRRLFLRTLLRDARKTLKE